MPSWIRPTRKANSTTAGMRSPSGVSARALSSAMEMALVRPLISCREKSSRAPTAVITTAVYRPYWGGSPARVA
jgi:hypothetical protein